MWESSKEVLWNQAERRHICIQKCYTTKWPGGMYHDYWGTWVNIPNHGFEQTCLKDFISFSEPRPSQKLLRLIMARWQMATLLLQCCQLPPQSSTHLGLNHPQPGPYPDWPHPEHEITRTGWNTGMNTASRNNGNKQQLNLESSWLFDISFYLYFRFHSVCLSAYAYATRAAKFPFSYFCFVLKSTTSWGLQRL